MIATAPVLESPVREANPWRPVKRCQTLEDALIELKLLQDRGVESTLLMDDGITVIAQD